MYGKSTLLIKIVYQRRLYLIISRRDAIYEVLARYPDTHLPDSSKMYTVSSAYPGFGAGISLSEDFTFCGWYYSLIA